MIRNAEIEEADRVQRVDGARPEQGDAETGEDRAEQGGEVLRRLDQCVRGDERVLRDEIRDRRVAAQAGRTPSEAGDGRQRADRGGGVDEREHGEGRRAAEVGEDHHLLARPTVDQRADGDAEDHPGDELAEEQDAHPPGRARSGCRSRSERRRTPSRCRARRSAGRAGDSGSRGGAARGRWRIAR